MKTKRYSGLLVMMVVFYCCALLVSNVIASKVFTFIGITLPSAVIIFPIVYILNDVISEVYGFKMAKKAVFLGFLTNIIAVIAYKIAILLPSPDYMFGVSSSMEILLGTTARTLIASITAYVVGAIANAKVMEFLKSTLPKQLFLRCVTSTIIGEGLDSIIFITIVFAWTVPFNVLVAMILSQAVVKTVYEIVVYPVTKMAIGKAKIYEGVE